MATYHLTTPLTEESVRALHVGDTVYLSGTLVTARDAAHRYIVETFLRSRPIPENDLPIYEALRRWLAGGVIYHCGPVVRRDATGRWEFVAAGPTSSLRTELYAADLIEHFGLRGIVGKGGMGARTHAALQQHGAVYLHAVGGAAILIAQTIREVLDVFKLDEFGTPEALWVVRAENLPTVVTMDTHGRSIHEEVRKASQQALERLLTGR